MTEEEVPNKFGMKDSYQGRSSGEGGAVECFEPLNLGHSCHHTFYERSTMSLKVDKEVVQPPHVIEINSMFRDAF